MMEAAVCAAACCARRRTQPTMGESQARIEGARAIIDAWVTSDAAGEAVVPAEREAMRRFLTNVSKNGDCKASALLVIEVRANRKSVKLANINVCVRTRARVCVCVCARARAFLFSIH